MNRAVFDHDFADLPRILPIFPLPSVLLLPGGQLPLNVFEPRYLALVRDALASDRLIGMIQPCESAADVGAAKVYGTGCAGRITAFSETPDGRYVITLTGVIRFDCKGELPKIDGYRRVISDYSRFRGDLAEDDSAIDRDRLLAALRPYFDATGIEVDWAAIKESGDEPLVTSLAMICPFEGAEKQVLLESMTLRERVEALTAIIQLATYRAPGDGAPH